MVKALVLNGLIFLGGLLILETFYNEPTHRFLGCSYAVRIGRKGLYCRVVHKLTRDML